MKRSLVLMLIMTISTAALAEPFGLKGIALGQDFTESTKGISWHKCEASYCLAMLIGKPMPHELRSIATVEMTYFIVQGLGREVDRIEAWFSSSGYDLVRAALEEKYGRPVSVLETPVQNRFGATYTNEETAWTASDGSRMTIHRFASDLKRSEIKILSAEAVKRQGAAAAEGKRAAAKDL